MSHAPFDPPGIDGPHDGIHHPFDAFQAVPETLPEPPLPGGVAEVVRWFMHVPQVIQIGGAILAAIVAVALLVVMWRKHRAIGAWLLARSRGLQIGMAAAAALLLIMVASFGMVAYDYVEHDNDFCTACHVMGPAYQRFMESEHAQLLCHDCHQQPLSASARQLYLWVLDRPEEIGPHAPVPDRVCAECHISDDPGERWERIAATAGHRVHLTSDHPDLGDVMCVTCHGQEVHEFVPADLTCGQAGCHAPAETRVVLGAMTGVTGLHCVTCHEFTAVVPEEAPADVAFGTLRPGEGQCFSCHDMQALLADFDPLRDPHGAQCALCHDPHRQETPAAAFATCTGAGCHERPAEETPFHRGIAETVLADCAGCHGAHDWMADGTNCVACHPDVATSGGGRLPGAHAAVGSAAFPPRSSLPARHPTASDAGPEGADASSEHLERGVATARHQALSSPLQASQPFDHARHREVACTACHSSARRHGEVIVRAADCFSCHHTAPVVDRGCASCHTAGELAGARPATVELRLGVWDAPHTRTLPFDHAVHAELACADCHLPRTVQVAAGCADCHADHHRPEADCALCHAVPPPGAHTVAVHLEGCAGAGCHAPARGIEYGRLDRTRSFCLSCHREQLDHEPGQLCVRCHLVPA